jgi:citrate lyase subunit beta/citryl-CoA lyase
MTRMNGRYRMDIPRTYLFVPGDRPERFAKALASGADAVVLDLEDAVSAASKAQARTDVAAWLRTGVPLARIVVRINDESTPHFDADLVLLAACAAPHVMLAKAERVATVERLLVACPALAVLPLVETARGMLAAQALAAAPGVQRLVFGTIDYALDLDLGADPLALDAGHAHLALVSRAAGITSPVAGVTTAIDDEPLLRADMARARAHGFGAKLCIHPRQVAQVHAALAPTAEELAWAQRVLQAAGAAGADSGAVLLEGRMIDRPIIERARRIAARAA